MFKLYLTLTMVLFLSACASGYRYGAPEKVIIDTLGVDLAQYQVDLADCEQYAAQINVANRTVEGAVGGAVVGGVLGAVVGNSDTAERSAGAGAVLGGVKSNKRSRHKQDMVVRKCLKGRGYRVLN